jgi:hypothetical protein
MKHLQAAKDAKNKTAYLAALKAYQKDFLNDINKLVESYKPIEKEKKETHDIIAAKNPDPLQKGIDKTIGLRGREEDWKIALRLYQDNLNIRIDNLEKKLENVDGGTDITAPFASDADSLEYFP